MYSYNTENVITYQNIKQIAKIPQSVQMLSFLSKMIYNVGITLSI